MSAAEQETGEEEHSRRLESDDEAVQVLTIHRSKGLEFPVVYYPFLWEPFPERKGEPVTFHDPAAADALTVDVGLEGADFARHAKQHQTEQRGEELRLAYVALTRAQHQAVLWWAGSYDTQRLRAHAAAVLARRGRDRRGVREERAHRRGRADALRGARGRGAGLHRAGGVHPGDAGRRGRARSTSRRTCRP